MRLLLIPVAWAIAMLLFSLFGAMALDSSSDSTSTIVFWGGTAIITVACIAWFIAWL